MIPSYTKFLQDLSLPRGTGSDGVLAKLLVSLKILSRCGIRKAKEMGLWSGVWSSLPPSLPQPQVDAPHKLLWDWEATLRGLGMENMGRPGQARPALCQGDCLQCHGLVAPGEKVWPRSGATAEKEVGDESHPWTPLSFTSRAGPAQHCPLSSL